MKKAIKIILISLAVILIAAQFVRPDLSNPPITDSERLEAATEVPTPVGAIFERSCRDCHSNATNYPWYSQISPVSWWLKDHIDEGRKEMNFSVWNTYNAKRKDRKLEEICEKVTAGEMPLPSYTWGHWDASLSPEDVRTLCEWTRVERERLGPIEK